MSPQNDFATIEDLTSFWKPLTGQEDIDRATYLLHVASNYLRQIAKNNCVDLDEKLDYEDDSVFADSLKFVTVSAVKRAMLTPADMPPVDHWSQSASPYSETMKFTNPSSDLFFKKSELQLIGFSSVSGRSQFGLLRGVR